MTRKILFFLLLTSTSCASIYRFSVDVQEPASVTLPVSAQNVLVLNSTVTPPENYGIDRMLDGHSIPTDYPLSMDSMAWSAIDELSSVLNASHFFKTISIYRQPVRSDTEWLSRADLSPATQSDFYEADNYDALLVIDRLLLSVDEKAKRINTEYLASEPSAYVDLRADGILTCSMYVYGKERPITTFNVTDSVFMKSIVENDSIVLLTKVPEYMLDELSRKMGNHAATYFIPTWKTTERILFTGYRSRMQEAASYASNRQWTNAEAIWSTEMEKATKPFDKAKIAFNLAVANEMQDKIDRALEWAQQAKEYLESIDSKSDSQETELTNQYISALEQRIQHNHLLDLQWGKE